MGKNIKSLLLILFIAFSLIISSKQISYGQTCGGGGSTYSYVGDCCANAIGWSCCATTTDGPYQGCSWAGGICQRYEGTAYRQSCSTNGLDYCTFSGPDTQRDLYGSSGCYTDLGGGGPPPPGGGGGPPPPPPPPPPPTYDITGYVFKDFNKNSSKNSGDTGVSGRNITILSWTEVTNSSGYYNQYGFYEGDYTVNASGEVCGWHYKDASVPVALFGGNKTANFPLFPNNSTDIVPQRFELRDVNGVEKNEFNVGDKAYVYVSSRNIGTNQPWSSNDLVKGAINRNQPTPFSSAVDVLTATEPDNFIFQRNLCWKPDMNDPNTGGVQWRVGSYPGGENESAFVNRNEFTVPSTPGVYTARVYLDFENNVTEPGGQNISANQMTYTYTVRGEVQGSIFEDTNGDGGKQTSEPLYVGTLPAGALTVDGNPVTVTNGNYSVINLGSGNHTVSFQAPSGYKSTHPTGSYAVGLSGGVSTVSPCNTTLPDGPLCSGTLSVSKVNFGITGKYSVSGVHFIDTDGSNKLNSPANNGEVNYPVAPNITVTSKPAGSPSVKITRGTDGTYLVTGMVNGDYTIKYVPPSGFFVLTPKPPQFSVTFNGTCSPPAFWSSVTGATCLGGNISNLNIPITQGNSWFQSIGGDVRVDDGFSDQIPATVGVSSPIYKSSGGQGYALARGTDSHGILFAGKSVPNVASGLVSESPAWQVSGITGNTYIPVNANSLRTSYDYLLTSARQQGVTPTDLTTVSTSCSNLLSCSIPNTIAGGVYKANGPVNLIGFTIAGGGNKSIIILVNGDFTIQTPIDIPIGSSVVFIAKGDIIVASGIGSTAPPAVYPPVTSDIEGFFSADENFILQGNDDCSIAADKMLSIEGSVVVNAALLGSGVIQNNRNLCGNSTYPSFLIKERPDMILNMPNLIKIPTYIWQEVAP